MSENLQQIMINYLFDKAYDGLCNPEEHCACTKEKLMPCGFPSPVCLPGYKTDIGNNSFKIIVNQD